MSEAISDPLRTYLRTSGSPWRRWAARSLDSFVFAAIIGSMVSMPTNDEWARAASVGMLLLWVPVEALLLATVRSTPGKWLFGLSVGHSDGSGLSFGQAVKRAGMVFVFGLGCGFLAMFAGPWAFWRIANYGMTSWDRECATFVECHPHVWRTALGIALLLLAWRVLIAGANV